MAEYDDLIEAQLAGAHLSVAALVTFDFKSGPVRLWSGTGDLAAAGETWQGIGELGQMSAITAGTGLAAEEVDFSLFGSEGLLANLAADAEEAAAREVTVRLQFFRIAGVDVHAPIDETIIAWAGTMGPLTAAIAAPASADAQGVRSVSVTAVNAFSNRNRPAFAFYSDRDQKALVSSDDNIFVRMATYAAASVAWPVGFTS